MLRPFSVTVTCVNMVFNMAVVVAAAAVVVCAVL